MASIKRNVPSIPEMWGIFGDEGHKRFFGSRILGRIEISILKDGRKEKIP
jgi:hypothetical protein